MLWNQVLRTEERVSYPVFVQVLVTCERRVSAGVMAVLEVGRGGALTKCARVCVCVCERNVGREQISRASKILVSVLKARG